MDEPYESVWAKQKDWLNARIAGNVPNALFLGQHQPVYTLGRGTHPQNLLHPQFPCIEVERGGDITYHGPGQWVAYPIGFLPPDGRNLHQYLRQLETWIISCLNHFGIPGQGLSGKTGVWVPDEQENYKKIASIGIAVRHWVTYHGIALNIEPDLAHYQAIQPCGFSSNVMTRLVDCLPSTSTPPTMEEVATVLIHTFTQQFNVQWMNDVPEETTQLPHP